LVGLWGRDLKSTESLAKKKLEVQSKEALEANYTPRHIWCFRLGSGTISCSGQLPIPLPLISLWLCSPIRAMKEVARVGSKGWAVLINATSTPTSWQCSQPNFSACRSLTCCHAVDSLVYALMSLRTARIICLDMFISIDLKLFQYIKCALAALYHFKMPLRNLRVELP
jgi:hypothetical protein